MKDGLVGTHVIKYTAQLRRVRSLLRGVGGTGGGCGFSSGSGGGGGLGGGGGGGLGGGLGGGGGLGVKVNIQNFPSPLGGGGGGASGGGGGGTSTQPFWVDCPLLLQQTNTVPARGWNGRGRR